MVGARFETRRFGGGRRRFEKAFSRPPRRRLVTFNAGNFTITPPTTVPPLSAPPKQPHFPPTQLLNTPFSSFSNPPKSQPPHPPLFSSFADLFKSKPSSRPSAPHPIPPSQRGILPLPEAGWTTVSYKKRRSSANHPSRPFTSPPKPKRCFFCGDRSHMARSCSLGDFKCFACNSIGHTSASCTNKKNPPLLSITPPSSEPPPLFIPSIALPESVIENMVAFSCFGFFSLQVGNPSLEELTAKLELHLKVERRSLAIRPISSSSYFIQFPNEETLHLACSKEFFDMGSFGGSFVPWTESKGLKPLPKFIYTWVEILNLPMHLWDSEFLMQLLGDIGDVITVSDDVIIKKNAKECKAMLSVRDPSEIPRAVTFRYASPDGEHIMEGNVQLRVVGKPLTERKGKCLEHFENFVRSEGVSQGSSEEGMKDSHIPPSPHRSSSKPDQPGSGPSLDPKGKRVIEADFAAEGLHRVPPLVQPPHPLDQDDLVDAVIKGVPIKITKASWNLLAETHPSLLEAFSPSRQTPVIPQIISSSSNSMEVMSSSAPPPGFERPTKKGKKKSSGRQFCHLPHRKHIAIMKRSSQPAGSKGKSVSNSSSFPINAMNHNELRDISVNCGIKESIDPLGLEFIKALELEKDKRPS